MAKTAIMEFNPLMITKKLLPDFHQRLMLCLTPMFPHSCNHRHKYCGVGHKMIILPRFMNTLWINNSSISAKFYLEMQPIRKSKEMEFEFTEIRLFQRYYLASLA